MKVFINADGSAARPEPGPAGAGYVILYRGESGWETVIGAVPLRPCTNYEAEYRAAILALAHAARLGATSVVLRTDSQLLVKQTNGQSKVKAPKLKPLAKKLRLQIAKIGNGRVEVVWIDRKQNKAADKLAEFAREKSANTKW